MEGSGPVKPGNQRYAVVPIPPDDGLEDEEQFVYKPLGAFYFVKEDNKWQNVYLLLSP